MLERTSYRRLGALLALALGALSSCAREAQREGSGRGVLVITIDGLRADHMSYVGYDRQTAPAIEQFLDSGVGFRQAFTTAPWSLPAHASILTGCDPNVARRMLPAGVPETPLTVWNLPDEVPRVAVEYLKGGYRTAAFLHGTELASAHGFEPGFELFQTLSDEEAESGFVSTFVHWLRGLGPNEDWFAYVQIEDLSAIWRQNRPQWDATFEPREELEDVPPVAQGHNVYFAIARRNWGGGTNTIGEYEAKYDGAIRRVDEKIGRFLKLLVRERRLEHTTVVIAGTHGVSFGEGGLILDHGTLSPSDIHVPLIIRPARGTDFERGLVTDALASLADLSPTLLELSKLPVPGTMQGVSLASVLRGELPGPRAHAFASCALYEGYAVMGPRFTFEARMPGVKPTRTTETWYGDADPHSDDYVELFYERGVDAYDSQRMSWIQDPVARAFQEAGGDAFVRTHELRQRIQPSSWGLSAADAPLVPSVYMWWRGHSADSPLGRPKSPRPLQGHATRPLGSSLDTGHDR